MLSELEEEVLDWLARGYSYEQTARMLRIGFDDVKASEVAIYQKLKVTSRRDAVREAVRTGWLVA